MIVDRKNPGIPQIHYTSMGEPIITYLPYPAVRESTGATKKELIETGSKQADCQYSLIVPFHVPSPDRCAQNKKWLDGIITNSQDGEIIIVDNGSCGEWKTILSQYATVKAITSEDAISYSLACNIGARNAIGNTLCFLNSDVEINSKEWSLPFREALQDEGIGLVGASGRKLLSNKWVAGNVRHDNDVDYIEGWCIWIRREIFDLLNGWDERYAPFYFEDTDFSFRVRYSLCKEIMIIPFSKQYINHLGGMTIKRGFEKYRERLLSNKKQFQARWHGVFTPGKGFVEELGIAILIPAHVDERYLVECLESVKASAGSNISVYVGLDRMEFLRRDDYPFAKFIDLDFGNVNQTRNYLVANSIEPLIYFLDADNYLKPGAIEKMKAALLRNDADVVYCKAEILDESTTKWFGNATDGLLNTYQYDSRLLRERNYIDMGSFIRRSALPSGRPFDIDLRSLQDWDLWLRMSASGKKFFYLEEPLYFYRIHDDNLSRGGRHWEESIAKLRLKHGNDIGCKQKKKRISVVTIAKTRAEIDAKIRELSNQTMPVDEFCTSMLPGIPNAWAEAFSKVTGDIIVVTETDAHVVNERFIEDLVSEVHDGEIVKGLEINHRMENFANIAFFAELLKTHRINPEYPFAEDTEWYARLKKDGIVVRHINGGAVVHDRGFATQKQFDRAYEYGRLHVRLIKKHGYYPLEDLIKRFELQKKIAEESLRGIRDELEAKEPMIFDEYSNSKSNRGDRCLENSLDILRLQ